MCWFDRDDARNEWVATGDQSFVVCTETIPVLHSEEVGGGTSIATQNETRQYWYDTPVQVELRR